MLDPYFLTAESPPDAVVNREDAVRLLLHALIRAGCRRARYYEIDTNVKNPGLIGFDDVAVLVAQAQEPGAAPVTKEGFSIPWKSTALYLDGKGRHPVVTKSHEFLLRHPSAQEWVDAIDLQGCVWMDSPVLRNGEPVGLIAADWLGEVSDVSPAFRDLLMLQGYRVGSLSDSAEPTLRPLAADDADPDVLVEDACQELMVRIDAMFGAVFRYDWRSDRLTKVREWLRHGPNEPPNEVHIEEDTYSAGREYLTGRAWSDDGFRYVADLPSLERAHDGWVSEKSQSGHQGRSGVPTKTVLYAIAGDQERRYLLRFMNRVDNPALPFLRQRRRVLARLVLDLQATVDLDIANRRVTSLGAISSSAVTNIDSPEMIAKEVEAALRGEDVEDFLYVGLPAGASEPSFVHSAGRFRQVGRTGEPLTALTTALAVLKADETFEGPVRAQLNTGTTSANPALTDTLNLTDPTQFVWADASAGTTSGFLLTTATSSTKVVDRTSRSLLFQAYCDLLTTSIDAATKYISEDGARKALGYIGHEIGTPFAVLGDAAVAVSVAGLNAAAAIRHLDPAASADLRNTSQRSYQRIQRNRDELDRVMEIAPVLASMGSGVLKMYLRRADLTDIVSTSVDRVMTETRGEQPTLSGSSAPSRSRRFTIDVTESVSRLPWITCDEGHLLQALLNLLRNAVKYSLPRHPPTPMKIIVSGRSINEGLCAVTIENWGLGVPPDLQSKIFLPFVRAQINDRLKALPGMGLGLYLVRTLVSAHDGVVDFRSVPTLDDPARNELFEGWLTTFEIRLPTDLEAGSRSVVVDPAARTGIRRGASHG